LVALAAVPDEVEVVDAEPEPAALAEVETAKDDEANCRSNRTTGPSAP
jgi:hypothetical protein